MKARVVWRSDKGLEGHGDWLSLKTATEWLKWCDIKYPNFKNWLEYEMQEGISETVLSGNEGINSSGKARETGGNRP